MDKLGTYALVAALKEISQRKQPSERKNDGIAQNERWISLRSCAHELPQATLEPPVPPPAPDFPAQAAPDGRINRHLIAEQRLMRGAQTAAAHYEEAPVLRPLSTMPETRTFSSIRQIEMRHQAARTKGGIR